MVYRCSHCDYETNIKCNYERHINKKRSCYKELCDIETKSESDKYSQNVHLGSQNVHLRPNDGLMRCEKCDKLFNTVYNLKRHQLACVGVDSLTCSICYKRFSCRQAKSNHKKYNRCHYQLPKHQAPIEQVITVNGDHNTLTNNNLTINVFGNENLEHISNDGNVLQRLCGYGKKGVYGLSDIVKEVHCNNDIPENNTIIKPHEHGDGVMIMGDNNEWEYREFEDVRETMINSVSSYINACDKMRKQLKIKYSNSKERNLVKGLAYKLLSLEGEIPIDMIDELRLDLTKVDTDDNIIKATTRKFDKATMSKLHEHTQLNYKKNNGKYIRKLENT